MKRLIFCRVTPAAQLISWLQWHLPPILLPVPHKQIKQLYLSLSRLHFTLMTLHLHLSFVSLSQAPSLPWQPPGCHLYANTHMWLGKKEKKKNKNSFSSYRTINIAQQSCRLPVLYQIRLPWLDTASRESGTCCLQSWVKCWQGQGAQRGSWT